MPPRSPARIEGAVDALRGVDMLCTIALVNTGLAVRDMLAGKGPLLDTISWLVGIEVEHPDWVWLSAYDLLFPLFIFIVGVVIPISLRRQVEREGLLVAHWRVLRRTGLLFFLGFLYYGGLKPSLAGCQADGRAAAHRRFAIRSPRCCFCICGCAG